MHTRIQPSAAPALVALVFSFLLLFGVGAAPAAAKEGAQAIALSGDGTRLYVARTNIQSGHSTGAVVVVDTTALKVVATLQPADAHGTAPLWNTIILYSMAIGPDGSRLYVARYGAVDVVDPAADRLVATVPVGPLPTAMAASPDGSRLYLGNFDPNPDSQPHASPHGGVTVVDSATDQPLTTLDLGPQSKFVVVSPDGRRLYVIGYDAPWQPAAILPPATLKVVDTATLKVVGTLSPQRTIDGAALSPDGMRLYLTTRPTVLTHWEPDVEVYDTATNQQIAGVTIRDGKYVFGLQPVISPDGKRLYLTMINSSDQLRVMDAVTLQPLGALTQAQVPQASWLLAISPDGGRLYLVNQAGDTLWVVDSASLQVTATLKLKSAPTSAP